MRVHRLVVWVSFAFALTIAPAASAAPCAGFVDVQDTDQFCLHIEWLRNRAITLGCTTTQYCPGQYVRRDQMAAFLYRLGVQNAFLQGGNAFGTTATLGTTDNRALQVNVNGARALLVVPANNPSSGASPNLVGGASANQAAITCAGICIPTPEPVVGATVAGGGRNGAANRVTDSFGTVAGGQANRAGNDNADEGDAAFATIAGGISNTASRYGSAIGGGASNIASGGHATIGGGSVNEASGPFAVVSGGFQNVASGGASNVPGGQDNQAAGEWSFAAGRSARAQHDGCFVWGDSRGFAVACTQADQFVARATGGARFITAINSLSGSPTAGVDLPPGDSSWNVLSDRAAKANWRDVDAREVLDRLLAMPIGEWNYRAQSEAIRHMGPSAQDFRAAFGLGYSDRMISTVDADGVALAAIQGLNRKLEQEVESLAARNAALEATLVKLDAKLRAVEASQQARTALSTGLGSKP